MGRDSGINSRDRLAGVDNMHRVVNSSSLNVGQWFDGRATAIWTNLHTNHLWHRMVKNTLATTLCVTIAVIPAVVRTFGTAAYLAPIVTVFGHPGRRFGQMTEALVLATIGALVAIGWSILGIYLCGLVFDYNESAAYTIKALFLVASFMAHGVLRSHSPRLFVSVVLLVLVCVVSLTSPAREVSKSLVTAILYPILTGVGVLLFVNISVFPEFSSDFLGFTTIETLGEAVGALRDAGKYFTTITEDHCTAPEQAGSHVPRPLQSVKTFAEKSDVREETASSTSILRKVKRILDGKKQSKGSDQDEAPKETGVRLQRLTEKKAQLRAKLAGCKAAQQECNFELAWSILPPRDLKPINDVPMKKLVSNAIALIGACESKYALMGDITDSQGSAESHDATAIPLGNLNRGSSSRNSLFDSATRSDSADSARMEGLGPEEQLSYKKKPKKKTKKEWKVDSRSSSKSRLDKEKEDLARIKPQREIASGDVDLLKYLVAHVSHSLSDLQESIDRSVDVVTTCLAYCYDVKKLPSGVLTPRGIRLEEIDIRVDILTDALRLFDRDSNAALERAALLQNDLDRLHADVMPRMETFLISAFMLNLRQAALHVLEMLRHSRVIVEKTQARHERKRFYTPTINFRKWLTSGGEENENSLPERGRKAGRRGNASTDDSDTEETSVDNTSHGRKQHSDGHLPGTSAHGLRRPKTNGIKECQPTNLKQGKSFDVRNGLADTIEFFLESESFAYAIKLTIAATIVSWPAFVPGWNNWYHLNRALWAPIQLVLVTDVALGISIWTFILRAVGTTLGCLWGFAAYESGNGHRAVVVVMLAIGVIPSVYVQLGSKYIKAGMVSTISMCIVALGTLDPSVPGTSTETFLRRLIAFLIGGAVALTVDLFLFPVRARDRLVDSLAASLKHVTTMEACLAQGVETELNVTDGQITEVSKRFEGARTKAQNALAAAETFLPFCEREPRLKGSFQGLGLIYSEIIYVLHAIVDRMDDMLNLRFAYGSGVLEEFNEQVYRYRRNVAGSITLILFAVHEGLTTKLPLPQYLPSARLAHLRMVNRVREILLDVTPEGMDNSDQMNTSARSQLEMAMIKKIFCRKFLAWNAAATGQIEVIEYLEELVDLVKLLVGANEFRTGVLTRPNYPDYARSNDARGQMTDQRDGPRHDKLGGGTGIEPNPKEQSETSTDAGTGNRKPADDDKLWRSQSRASLPKDELPPSLQRVRTRRLEEMKNKNMNIKAQEPTHKEEDESGKATSASRRE